MDTPTVLTPELLTNLQEVFPFLQSWQPIFSESCLYFQAVKDVNPFQEPVDGVEGYWKIFRCEGEEMHRISPKFNAQGRSTDQYFSDLYDNPHEYKAYKYVLTSESMIKIEEKCLFFKLWKFFPPEEIERRYFEKAEEQIQSIKEYLEIG